MKFAVAFLMLSAPCLAGEFNLKPGERVVTINGVPTGTNCESGQCRLKPPVVGQPIRNVIRHHHNVKVIKRDLRAWQWCMREAQLCAANGYRNGHPRGSCPGSTCTGTGYSYSPNNPNHCCRKMGEARCIARACYHCPRTGRYYWCAAYR